MALMFGEDPEGESPRLPSPWRNISRSTPTNSPSPLSLSTPSASSRASSSRSSSGAGRTPRLRESWEDELSGQFGAVHLSKVGIQPEVDKSGHTEYKLHLLTPAPHRFEKLKTQLKWRLIEGGGQALYELGVLDNGTLVGLAKADMEGSLDTLGKLLASLGGGRVRIDKVFRLIGGGEEFKGGPAQVDELEEADAAKLFGSFRVDPDPIKTARSASVGQIALIRSPSPELDLVALSSLDDLIADATLDSPPGPPAPLTGRRHKKLPSQEPKLVHQWTQRTPHERAQLKRAKRDERRAKVDEALAADAPLATATSAPSATPPVKPTSPKAIPPGRAYVNHKASGGHYHNPSGPSKVIKPGLKLSKSAPSAPNKLRPSIAREGEERWVVEVEVVKRSGGRKGSEGDDGLQEAVLSEKDEDEADLSDEPEHGWAYLEFDFLGAGG